MSLGIYIHWPYCLSKCPYCDFYKEVKKNVPQEEIVDGYLQDLDFYHQYTANRQVTSVFFGGGTPSLLKPENISKILNHISMRWKTASDVEVSLEANPNSHYPNMFKSLRSVGINRLSLGVQALNDADLRFLGRTHNLQQAYQSIDEVLQNFDNHSIDLIYGRPHQKFLEWEKELQLALSFGLKHISFYQLTIEEGTIFARKGITGLDEEAAAEMYLCTDDILSEHDYNKYEVSNYAKFGFESKHNKLYWQGQEYIGIGPSAAGRLSLTGWDGNLEQNSDARNSRTSMYAQVSPLRDFTLSSTSQPVNNIEDGKPEQNSDARNSGTSMYAQVSPLRDFTLSSTSQPVNNIEDGNPEQRSARMLGAIRMSSAISGEANKSASKRFYATTHRCQMEELTAEEKAEELLIMGLRLVSGIDKSNFESICGLKFDDFVNRKNLGSMVDGGWLIDTPCNIQVTKSGFLILNKIIEKLYE